MVLAEADEAVDYKKLYEDAMGKIAELAGTNAALATKCAEQDAVIAKLEKSVFAKQSESRPLSDYAFEIITILQYKVKSLATQLGDFKSGKKYLDMDAALKTQHDAYERDISKLKRELSAAHRQVVDVREKWGQTFKDVSKEHAKELVKKERELKQMENRALSAERKLGETKGKLLAKTREVYAVQTQFEELQGKLLKLTAQLNRNHENSSLPSSKNRKPKKIVNLREKSGKKPGGQIGHKHHPRRQQAPTEIIAIPVPEEFMNPDRYVPTGNIVTKQLVDIQLSLIVREYSTLEFRDKLTGTRVTAEFPHGLVDDVTYGGSVKALALLLGNHCNVSAEKVSDIIGEMTGGALRLSTGFINKLPKEFSMKTEGEQKKAFADALGASAMNVDCTTSNVNGKQNNVLICATPGTVMFFAREHKGHSCILDTPVELYQGTLIHDHDITFYKYGTKHQECLQHVLRYLKDSIQNEGHLTWNVSMQRLIREMIRFRKHLDPEDGRNPDKIDPGRVKELEAKYDRILEKARAEYEYEPASKYYKDGFNLSLRMAKYRTAHLLFLHDIRVDWTNNLAERHARVFKRKQHQAMVFRSFEGFAVVCNTLGVLATMRIQGKNLYAGAAEIFNRPIRKKVKPAA